MKKFVNVIFVSTIMLLYSCSMMTLLCGSFYFLVEVARSSVFLSILCIVLSSAGVTGLAIAPLLNFQTIKIWR